MKTGVAVSPIKKVYQEGGRGRLSQVLLTGQESLGVRLGHWIGQVGPLVI